MPSLLDYITAQQGQPNILGALQDNEFRNRIKQGLLDVANRGVVAGTLGGPVDMATGLINAGLMAGGVAGHKMGLLRADQLPTPIEKPIGGSEWLGGLMEKAGMVSPERNAPAELLAGIALPAAGARAAGLLGSFAEDVAAAPAKLRGPGAKQKGIFIGPGAKTWDKTAASKASELEKAGANAEDIWKQTGTFRGVDGKWRQEISDAPAQITDDVFFGIKEKQRFEGPMSRALTHENLYKAYPDTGEIGSGLYAWRTPEGSYHAATDTITAGGPGTTSQKSTALHELQHAIQQREGFARGGNPLTMQNLVNERADLKMRFDRALDQFMTTADPVAKSNAQQEMTHYGVRLAKLPKVDNAEDAYRALAGEAEARAVQARMNLTPEERLARSPWMDYDVPAEQQIVRFGETGPQMNLSYQGEHTPPMKGSGAPLHNLTAEGVYPSDLYSSKGRDYYATGDDAIDNEMWSIINKKKNAPNAPTKIYRAVPDDGNKYQINNGDWVTPSKEYAKQHGEGALGGKYKIISKNVPTRKLFTSGDSWAEFGYDESGRADSGLIGALAAGGAGAAAANEAGLLDKLKRKKEK